MSVRQWTDEEIYKLINLCEEKEFLWDIRHKLYRNKDVKIQSYEEIAKYFNCNLNEVQRKLHNLRNQSCKWELSLENTILKIKAAILRVGFNLWNIFRELDPYKTNYVSETKFLSVIDGPLKHVLGLDYMDKELLLNKFRAPDNRIAYAQICRMVHDSKDGPPVLTNENEAREDSYKSNELSPQEQQDITNILARIAKKVPPQRMILKPYFQDYEMIARGSGQVSKNTVKRILQSLGVRLTESEFNLLFSKYRYDAFTFKYHAFLKELNEVYQYFLKHGYMDQRGNFLVDSSDHIQLKPAPRGIQHGIMKVFSGNVFDDKEKTEVGLAFNKLKDHIKREQLRIEDGCQNLDPEDSGRIDKSEFQNVITSWICISETSFNPLYISQREIDLLIKVYQDEDYDKKVMWKVFMDDIEREIPPEILNKWPRRGRLRDGLNPFLILQCRPATHVTKHATFEDTMERIRHTLKEGWATKDLKKLFAEGMRKEGELLGREHFLWILDLCNIPLTESESARLVEHYGVDNGSESGINAPAFLADLKGSGTICNDRDDIFNYVKEENVKTQNIPNDMNEKNIVEVLAKIKRTVVCGRIWVKEALKPFDKMRKQLISKDEFVRGLDSCGVVLTRKEMDTVLDVFALPENPSLIEYIRFCQTIDEDSLPPCLFRKPLKEALAQEEAKRKRILPSHKFANFEDRIMLGNAMDKLVKHVTLANTDFFKSIDKSDKGTVSRLDFQQALAKLKCLHVISNRELDVIINGFGVTRDLDVELDYMAFLQALDIIHKTRKAAKNL